MFGAGSMLPIVLSSVALKVVVAGKGEGLKRRLTLLKESAVSPTAVFDDTIPAADELAGVHLVFVAGLDEHLSSALAKLARARGALVNVEDQPALCDFHVPASVRRGDLIITASTRGN